MTAAEGLYLEMEEHLLGDDRPSAFLRAVYDRPIFAHEPFVMLYKLRGTAQSSAHHPEGNVWNHTLLVVDEAAKVKRQSKNPRPCLWAALLHDIGKAPTTRIRRGKITAYDHDKAGAKLARVFLSRFSKDGRFIDQVCGLIRYHMQVLYVVKNLRFADIAGVKRHTDPYEVALLGLCDRLGRGGSDPQKEREHIQQFLLACSAYTDGTK